MLASAYMKFVISVYRQVNATLMKNIELILKKKLIYLLDSFGKRKTKFRFGIANTIFALPSAR